MRKLRSRWFIISAIVFFSQINISSAQEKSLTIKSFDIPYSDQKVLIDGDIDEPIWDKALNISLDLVNSPLNNVPSPVKTEAKIIENGNFLYIAFIAHDPEPEKIQGSLGDRDTKWFDDLVGIKLDTFNNRRLNYSFFVNPFGVQNDGIYNEMTGEDNTLWDGIWQSYGKKTAQGYQVEIAIPYHILNFSQNQQVKTWAMELARIYPRETRLRLSHVPLDRNNACWLCQYPEISGFEKAKIGNNLLLTPAVVATRNETRDIYDNEADWQSDEDIEAGLDVRWGISPNTLLNATLNPDFSTIESDAGQLNVNTNFSLFYDEKRPFFLENSDYFTSNFDLVYTRNIADPDYGVKLTGSKNDHTYAFFATNDTETNIIIPGNLSSDLAFLTEESHSSAMKYRYDYNDDFSLGVVSTIRTADNYHNYVAGIDTKYRFDDSNSILAQILTADTEYPDELYLDFCLADDCPSQVNTDCTFGNCNFTEQVNRTNQDNYSDQAVKVELIHQSEYWGVNAAHNQIGKDFRADLGFMPKADFTQSTISMDRFFYGDADSFWQEAMLGAQWQIEHNENDELISKAIQPNFSIDGPKLSLLEVTYSHTEKVGLRHDDSSLAIDGNTTRFTEDQIHLYGHIRPTTQLFTSLDITVGDKIDYNNNRLGDFVEITGNLTWNTDHFEADIFHTYSELESDGASVYTANLSEFRLSYQFDVFSYLKLNVLYVDVDRNPNNNPFIDVSNKNKNLSTQLIYAYKLNPQTVFYLGYSDSSFQDDYLDSLEREDKTFFTKISYAWRP